MVKRKIYLTAALRTWLAESLTFTIVKSIGYPDEEAKSNLKRLGFKIQWDQGGSSWQLA